MYRKVKIRNVTKNQILKTEVNVSSNKRKKRNQKLTKTHALTKFSTWAGSINVETSFIVTLFSSWSLSPSGSLNASISVTSTTRLLCFSKKEENQRYNQTKNCRKQPLSLFFDRVFLKIFLFFRNFNGESSVSASSCELLEAIVSTPSGISLTIIFIFFLPTPRLKVNILVDLKGKRADLHLTFFRFGSRKILPVFDWFF